AVDAADRALVVPRQDRRARKQRQERIAIPRIAADRERTERVAVEAELEADDPRATGVLPGRLQRTLDRLRAAADEIRALERRAGERDEARRETYLRLQDELPVHEHVQVTPQLSHACAPHGGMGVADVRHAHTGEEIEVPAAAD